MLGPAEVDIRGALPVGAAVRDRFSPREGVAIGYVTELPEGATVVAELDAPAPTELFTYGPLSDEGWFGAPVVARDGGHGALPVVAPEHGTYLVAALGPPGEAAPFLLSLRSADRVSDY